jgi:probable F420-dependent oxidoreductase
MRIGVVFPQTEIGADPAGVRDYVQAAESLGYDHLVIFDHVIGANVASRPGWRGAYESRDMFHEPMVLFGYLAGLTQTIELFTGILILPQRQTVLVAKQAAAVDVLSKGRLRLGIGTGWNDVEYEALGENFHDRGRRSEEQIGLMRRLWTQEHVTYDGRWHRITDAGINPLPVQRPIPVWLGGGDDRLLDRVGRMGDGWYALFRDMDTGRAMIEKIRTSAEKAGRDPNAIGIEASVAIRDGASDQWVRDVEARKKLGISHLSVNTIGAGLSSPEGHVDAIRRFKEAVDGI